MRILEKNNIDFKVYTYEADEFIDGVTTANRLSVPVDKTYKTLVTQGKSKDYFVFVIPVAEELDLKKAAASVGEKALEMIPVKDINKVTGYIRGGCTSIGMKKQYQTVVDISAAKHETMMISGGRIGSQMELSPNDLINVVNGSFADVIVHR
jgi:Cys-tRNA(Pro)/Cys-tRNA(Cys) deacylase